MDVLQTKTSGSRDEHHSALGMIITFQRSLDEMGKDELSLPLLAASSSSSDGDETNKSWMKRLVCTMDVDYACGGGGNDFVLTKQIFGDGAPKLEDISVITETQQVVQALKTSNNVQQEQQEVPMEINTNPTHSSHCSPVSIATEQGVSPIWMTMTNTKDGTINYDFPSLLAILTNLSSHPDVRPLSLIRDLLEQDKWSTVFSSISPREYARLIMTLDSEFDRPEIAALVAPTVNDGNFTHEYVIAVLGAVADWSRPPLITKLLPLCKDLEENEGKIRAELSEWDIVCTKGCFEETKCLYIM